MKNFWPHRSDAKGFSIKKLADRYRLNISSSSVSSDEEVASQFLDNGNLVSMKEEDKKISIANLSIKRIHWANRDFSEYKKAA